MEVDSPSAAERVVLRLPTSVGLVLFEVIARSLSSDNGPRFDELERVVLQRLVDALDEELGVAEREDYLQLLEQARRLVLDDVAQRTRPRAC
jgi:hypothetical protein